MALSGKCNSDFDCEGSSVCCRLTISQDKACHTWDECYPSPTLPTFAPDPDAKMFAILFGSLGGVILLLFLIIAVIRFRATMKLRQSRLMAIEVSRIPPIQPAPQYPSMAAPAYPTMPAPQAYSNMTAPQSYPTAPPNPHIQAQPVWTITNNYQNNYNPPSYDEAVKRGEGFQNVPI